MAGFHDAYERYWSGASSHLELARAFDLLGEPDSAIHYFGLFDDFPRRESSADALWRPKVHKRFGELYEARGDRDMALQYYNRFVDRWRDADPELQPLVEDVHWRIAALVAER